MVGYQQEDHRYDMHKGYRENYAFPDYPVLDAGGEENQKHTVIPTNGLCVLFSDVSIMTIKVNIFSKLICVMMVLPVCRRK